MRTPTQLDVARGILNAHADWDTLELACGSDSVDVAVVRKYPGWSLGATPGPAENWTDSGDEHLNLFIERDPAGPWHGLYHSLSYRGAMSGRLRINRAGELLDEIDNNCWAVPSEGTW